MKQERPIRVAVFSTLPEADKAVEGLLEAGFPKDAVSVVCPSCEEADLSGVDQEQPAGARTPTAIAAGGTIGAVLGGFAMASIVASGGTTLLVVGPILGSAAGGITGGFVGAMATRGLEREIADFYDQALRNGQILVSVEAADGDAVPSLSTAERVFAEAGAAPLKLPEG